MTSSNRIHETARLYEQYQVSKERLELAKKNFERSKKELIEFMKQEKLS